MPTSTPIALIDDDPFCNLAIRRVLEATGLATQLKWLRTGDEALRFLSHCPIREQPRVILLDIEMPGMNGIEFLRRARRTLGLRQMDIFMFTGSREQADYDAAISLGASGYLQKPDGDLEMRGIADRLAEILLAHAEQSSELDRTG